MKNFTDLNDCEKIKVLEWRNNARVRLNMLNNRIISKDEHFAFLNSLKKDSKRKYFLLDNIGVISFTNINEDSANIGLYSNPNMYNIGMKLMDTIINFNFNYLYLEVLKSNENAINLYKKYNFKKSINNNHKETILMEFKR